MADIYSLSDSSKSNKRFPYKKSVKILSARHPRLKLVLKKIGHLSREMPIWNSIDSAILYAVTGQMLSVSVACSIISRLLDKFGTPQRAVKEVGKTSHALGGLYGLSHRKRKTFMHWREFVKNNGEPWLKWKGMDLDKYYDQVTSIWGLGRWSADMIGIFYLGRMDIWPESDTGIRKVSKLIFGTNSFKKIRDYINKHETVTALYFWEVLNRKFY